MDWYKITLYRLIEVCKEAASKYTRSKVRKALPPDFAYVIEELITEKSDLTDKEAYYEQIIETIITIGRAEVFIIALSEVIQRLVVDHMHILSDIYDRGPGPRLIMNKPGGTIRLIFSGEIMTLYGWEQQPDRQPVLQM